MYFIQHCFLCRPSDSIVSEDAGIEPKTVATLVWVGYKNLVVHYFHQVDDFHRFFILCIGVLFQISRCAVASSYDLLIADLTCST